MENAYFTLPASVFIRPAAQQDLTIIYGFLCELEEMLLDFSRFREVYTHNLTNPMIHYLVAERNGEVVGFVSCHGQYLLHHTGKVGEIQELFVKPAHRNQQVGHQLLAALEALAVQEGFVNLEVTTNQKRLDTIRFYEREAFNRTHFKLVKPIQP
ncbi:GNAT family N-acetyltransferase [Spirosoma taeanense]|uniref:GNAT family N-acetyltransferase n=1 Tax=Spirosoma taeanense TaxID=2735870 RepID=A0A6M5Y752_9BACT|nr:GNAT family N-acetyltransferase [Spirosoma taeanense]QJW88913.1 GNAT family N-acetyltransferase [Spirosoma taeanense]